jgi:hypothetical protein
LIDTAENAPKRSGVNTPFEISVGKQADSKDVVSSVRHVFRWSLLTSIRVGFAFFSIALALDAAASIKEEGPTPDLVGKTRLKSTEITRLFSDVIDRGEVQNQRGISAETHWHADGTFVTWWWTQASTVTDASDASDVSDVSDVRDKGAVKREVTGRWRTERDLRCVTFDSGTQPDWSCAEVWLLDDGRILSLNPDGSAHGLHRLSPLK